MLAVGEMHYSLLAGSISLYKTSAAVVAKFFHAKFESDLILVSLRYLLMFH